MQVKKRLSIKFLLFLGLMLTLTPAVDAAQPVPFGRLTSLPGWRKDPFGTGRSAYHRGYDIAVPSGTPVNPTAAGTVSFAGKYKGYGYLVAVDHGNGYVTMYGHLSRLLVTSGMSVTPQTIIALSGSTGRSTGPHLHYEIRQWSTAGGASSGQVVAKETSEIHKEGWEKGRFGKVAWESDIQARSDNCGWYHGM